MRERTALISLFSTDSRNAVDEGCGLKSLRQAGFSMLELLLVLTIIAIMAGLSVPSILELRENYRANQAMYQVVASLREARLMAMSQNRRISIQFPTNQRILVQPWDGSGLPLENISDPSTSFEYGYQFVRNTTADTPYNTAGGIQGAIVFDGTLIEPGVGNEMVFTTDGFLTMNSNFDDPIDGVVFIGLPNSADTPARAVTILGATGRISTWTWQRKRTEWLPVRK